MDFEATYRQHVQAVFRFALSVTRRRDVAEDLTSEAFLALYREQDTIDGSRLPAWLLTVVRNRARDLWRHQRVTDRHSESVQWADHAVAPDPPPLEEWILGSPDLKPIHRACVMLRYGRDMTRAEIAAELGLSETQVKGHLQYALTLLRKAHGLHDA